MSTFFHGVKFLAIIFISFALISIALIKNQPFISAKQQGLFSFQTGIILETILGV
jgi:hypothetical protein